MFLSPFRSFNRKCQIGSDKIGVALVEVKDVLTGIETNETSVFPHRRGSNMRQFELRERLRRVTACCQHPCADAAAYPHLSIQHGWN
jgi:hypothetical protein